jgi:hypothetical protein
MKIKTLSLILIINNCFGQTYQSEYSGVYKSKENSNNEIQVGDLMKDVLIDNTLFTYTMSIISNNDFSIIKVGITNMDLPIEANYETETFFIDYSNKIVYDLNKKTYCDYISNKVVVSKNSRTPMYEASTFYKGDTAIITIDKTLPKQLLCKSFMNIQKHGVRKIITKQDEVVLLNYFKTEFDFNATLLNIKKVCTVKGKQMNYLFGN